MRSAAAINGPFAAAVGPVQYLNEPRDPARPAAATERFQNEFVVDAGEGRLEVEQDGRRILARESRVEHRLFDVQHVREH